VKGGYTVIEALLTSSLGYVHHQGVLVVKTQWKLYQALELIPESVSHPKSSWFAWLSAPIRRPFANVFTRDLSPRHQVLLLKRCLAITNAQQPKPGIQKSRQVPSDRVLTQPHQFPMQSSLDPGESSWWPGYD
jgi:hypothetical protein